MANVFDKSYNHKEHEEKIYLLWEQSGAFAPSKDSQKPFCIIMPPPNANGDLHAGHALTLTIEDIMTRYNRMRGRKTLWLPGADHAGFETQVVYEKELERQGRSRFGMDKKALYDEILSFTLSNKENMEAQTKMLGASCDWSRKKFTLDSDIVKIVYQTFQKLNNDGLLYRGKRMVSWCVKHQTSFSDLEVVDREQTDKLYYIEYGPFVVATVRPETIFGDVAVAVNPNDQRYAQYVGKEIEIKNPIGSLKLKIIADEMVDMNFGTGALKITPAHDPNDFLIAERHNLSAVDVIDQYGKLNEKTGQYSGMNRESAREAIIEDLKKMKLLKKIEDYKHSVPTCYKCEKILEPRIMPQWFIKMKPLAERAIAAIEQGKIIYIPEHYKKITLHWLNNIIDWNISRQIVWGIPIPAKLCDSCGDGFADIENHIITCPKCGGAVSQDQDTFDTWFSSSQWPFAVLHYPNGEDFKTFYPTDVMETAGEIIFFWVARMIIMGLYATGDVPFKTVYLHGLVLDAKGRKMSKSKGNVINQLDLTEKFGTDALRIGLVVGNTPGTSLALSENKIKGYKHFANKIWNAARFVLSNTAGSDGEKPPLLTSEDQKTLDEFAAAAQDITYDMDNFRFYLAAEKIYHYFWHTFADKIIENAKTCLKADNERDKVSSRHVLRTILETSLKILHPFMPFVTETIWQEMHRGKRMLMVEKWPT